MLLGHRRALFLIIFIYLHLDHLKIYLLEVYLSKLLIGVLMICIYHNFWLKFSLIANIWVTCEVSLSTCLTLEEELDISVSVLSNFDCTLEVWLYYTSKQIKFVVYVLYTLSFILLEYTFLYEAVVVQFRKQAFSDIFRVLHDQWWNIWHWALVIKLVKHSVVRSVAYWRGSWNTVGCWKLLL